MKLVVTLSKKEKRYYFLYLVGMVILALVLCGILFLNQYDSPFRKSEYSSTNLLESKAKFDAVQSEMQKKVDSTFVKIGKLPNDNINATDQNEINEGIYDIRHAFDNAKIIDSRVKDFEIISGFYDIYLKDKNSISHQNKNLQRFISDYDECKKALDKKSQQSSQ